MTKTAEHPQSHRFFPEVEHFRNIARLHRLPTGFPECLGALPLRISQDHTLRSSFTELFRRMQQTYSDFTLNDAVWMLLTAIGGHTAANRQVAPEGVVDFVLSFVTSIGGWPETRRSSSRSPEPYRPTPPQQTDGFFDASRGNELSSRWNQPAPGFHQEPAPPASHRDDALAEITGTLARLERSTADLRLYLDSVDHRLARLEPLLDSHTAPQTVIEPAAPEPPPTPVAPVLPLVHRSDDAPAIPPTPQAAPESSAPSARASLRPRFAAAMDLPQTNSSFAAPFQHHSPPLRPAPPMQSPAPQEPTSREQASAPAPPSPPEHSRLQPQSSPTPSAADNLIPLPLAPEPPVARPAPTVAAPQLVTPPPVPAPPIAPYSPPSASVLTELNRGSGAFLPDTPLPQIGPAVNAPTPFPPQAPPTQAFRPTNPSPTQPHFRSLDPGIPEQRIPDQRLTDQGVPEQRFAEQRLPERTFPEQRFPEQRVPEQRVPEQRSPLPPTNFAAPGTSSIPSIPDPAIFEDGYNHPVPPSSFAPRAPLTPPPAASFNPPASSSEPRSVAQPTPPAAAFQPAHDTQAGRPHTPPPTFGTDLFGQHSPEDHDSTPKRSRTPLMLGLLAALLVALAIGLLARGRPLPSWTRIAPSTTKSTTPAADTDTAPTDGAAAPPNRGTAAPSRSSDPLAPGKVLGARAQESPQVSEQVLHDLTYVPELTLRSRLISGTPALYPRSPSGEAVRGTIALQVIVGPDGFVDTVTVLGGPKSLRDAAINAVRGWRFQPVLVHGAPAQIRSTLHIPVEPPDQQ